VNWERKVYPSLEGLTKYHNEKNLFFTKFLIIVTDFLEDMKGEESSDE